MTNAYDTIDKIRRLAEDDGATPGERAAAQAKLNQYSTALVVVRPNNLTWRDRMRATTETRVADEGRKQVAIRHSIEKAESDMAAYRIAQQTRILGATTDHELFMLEAEGKLREAQHRAEIVRMKLNAERATLGLAPL
jgi:hypothetical protein